MVQRLLTPGKATSDSSDADFDNLLSDRVPSDCLVIAAFRTSEVHQTHVVPLFPAARRFFADVAMIIGNDVTPFQQSAREASQCLGCPSHDRRLILSDRTSPWPTDPHPFAQQEILASGLRKEGFSMSQKKISSGVVHEVPADLKKALASDPQALAAWEDITPLARNEWICWIQSARKAETRSRRIAWGCSSLKDGERRPCCWPGCDHR